MESLEFDMAQFSSNFNFYSLFTHAKSQNWIHEKLATHEKMAQYKLIDSTVTKWQGNYTNWGSSTVY